MMCFTRRFYVIDANARPFAFEFFTSFDFRSFAIPFVRLLVPLLSLTLFSLFFSADRLRVYIYLFLQNLFPLNIFLKSVDSSFVVLSSS